MDAIFHKDWTGKQKVTKRGLTTNILEFSDHNSHKTPKNTLVQNFIKIGPVNQKLPEGG